VLRDLFEIGPDRRDELADFRARMRVEPALPEQLAQLVQQLARQVGKIVHEIERVLDLVSNPRGELAERGEFLRLDQPVLGLSEIIGNSQGE
jgi:hypothetical protein